MALACQCRFRGKTLPRQERVTKRTHTRRVDESEAKTPPQLKEQKKAQLQKELDEIVEEIDELLESNAEEFVSNYVQKGGE